MKRKYKKVRYSIALLGFLLISLITTGAGSKLECLAQEENTLFMTKTASENGDGTWNLNLEVYTKGEVTTTSYTKPADIVLTLDTSGSMNDRMGKKGSETQLQALKSAACNFIDSVAADCANVGEGYSVKHRIAITTFAGDIGITKQDFLEVSTPEQVAALKATVNGLTANGGTNTAGGMRAAHQCFSNNALKAEDRTRLEILFTDGEPTYHLGTNWKGLTYWGPGNSFDSEGAKQAIEYAYKMKHEFSASVYTVGMFSEANPADMKSNVNKFMNYVSSNYPDARSMSGGGTGSNAGYYMAVASAGELNNVFQSISANISTPKTTMEASTVLRDVISDSFALAGNVSVWAYPYLGEGAFDTTGREITGELSVTAQGNTVDVTGYDYKSHYVVDGSGDIATSGEKIVVTIPIKRNPYTYGGNAVPTNTQDSGLYDDAGNFIRAFSVPSVNVPVLYNISAQDKSIYLSQSADASELGGVSNSRIYADAYGMPVEINCVPDGVNNAGVTITYQVLDEDGAVLNQQVLEAGAALEETPFSYAYATPTENKKLSLRAVVTPVNEAAEGFTAAGEKVCEKSANIYVFLPAVTAEDDVIFYGEKITTQLLESCISQPIWSCEVQDAALPQGEAPAVTCTFENMEGQQALTDSLKLEKPLQVQVKEAWIQDMNITGLLTVYPAQCTAQQEHQSQRHFTIHLVKGQLDITKLIDELYTDIEVLNACETFLFKINQYEAVTNKQGKEEPGELLKTFYQTIAFDANGNITEGSASIKGLEKGYYTVTEESTWTPKYALTKTQDNDENNEKEGIMLFVGREEEQSQEGKRSYYGIQQGRAYLTAAQGTQAAVEFTNTKRSDWKWLSDVARAVNEFLQ